MAYEVMLYGGIVGALITLPLAIYLFIKLQIAQVVEDLTGFRLSKNENVKKRSYHADTSGGIKRTTSEIQIKKDNAVQQVASTVAIDTTNIESTTLLDEEEEGTTILGEEEGTTILTGEETTLLEDETDSNFVIEKNIMVVHSSKSI